MEFYKLTRQPFLAAAEIELSIISGLIMVFLAATKRTKMKLGSIIRNSIINTSVQTFLWISFSVAGSPITCVFFMLATVLHCTSWNRLFPVVN